MGTILNQPSVVDSAALTVSRSVTIDAPVDKVWAAITEPRHIARWFGQSAELEGTSVGARGVFSFDGYGDFPVEVEEVDPPRMIAYRWSNDNARAISPERVDREHSTVFRFTLERQGSGTRLTVVESGFGAMTDPAASLDGNRRGWDSELDELVEYLEAGS
jgi:uncharacterized protein YndB with AHSA1/START domain